MKETKIDYTGCDPEIGEVFELKGKKYKVRKAYGFSVDNCNGCCVNPKECDIFPECDSNERDDNEDIIFVELTEEMQILQVIKDAVFGLTANKSSKDDECEITTIKIVSEADQLKTLSDWLKDG